MTYTCKFKLKDSFFWKTYKKVRGDFVATDLPVPVRVLILEDESRVEIPMADTIFVFCSKRFLTIKQKMEQEAGQKIMTKE